MSDQCEYSSIFDSICSFYAERTHFRAASYEHVAVSRYNRDNSPDDIYAKYIISQNLKAFKEKATVASIQVN